MGLSAYLTYLANKDQADAAAQASSDQLMLAGTMAADARKAGQQGADILGAGTAAGQQQMYGGFQGALGAILGGQPLYQPQAPGAYVPYRQQLMDMYAQYGDLYPGYTWDAGQTPTPPTMSQPGAPNMFTNHGNVYTGPSQHYTLPLDPQLSDAAVGNVQAHPILASLTQPASDTLAATTTQTTSDLPAAQPPQPPAGSRTPDVGQPPPATVSMTGTGGAPQQPAPAPPAGGIAAGIDLGGVIGGNGNIHVQPPFGAPNHLPGGSGNSSDPPVGTGFDTSTIGATGARNALAGGFGGAMGTYGAYGQDIASRFPQIANRLDYNALASGFQTDPGYEFARQQGEAALARSAAARGGRLSGSTLQELSRYNQGLASQQFGDYMSRASGLAGQQVGVDLAGMAATGALANQVAGAQQNYGNALSNVATGAGTQLANLYSGYGNNSASLGQQGATGVANMLTGAQANSANILGNSLGAYAAGVPYAGAGYAAAGDALGQMGQLGMMYALSQG
jgi:hypothetical protein